MDGFLDNVDRGIIDEARAKFLRGQPASDVTIETSPLITGQAKLVKGQPMSTLTDEEKRAVQEYEEKREEIKRRELGQYGCMWDKYKVSIEKAREAGINPQTCEIALTLDYKGGSKASTWSDDFTAPFTWIIQIAPYLETIDLTFGFDSVPKKFDRDMLRAYWLILYLYIRKGLTLQDWDTRISNNAANMAGSAIEDVLGQNYNVNNASKSDIEKIARKGANIQIRSMIKRFRGKKGEIITIIAMSVITIVYSALAIAGAITTTGVLGGAGGTAAASTSTGAAATGEAAKDVGVIGTLGSGVAKAGDWLVKNGDKIALGKEVYDTVTKGEEETGLSVNEAGQVLEQDKELYGQSQLFKLTGTNAMIAAGIVFVIILGVFIWKRNR